MEKNNVQKKKKIVAKNFLVKYKCPESNESNEIDLRKIAQQLGILVNDINLEKTKFMVAFMTPNEIWVVLQVSKRLQVFDETFFQLYLKNLQLIKPYSVENIAPKLAINMIISASEYYLSNYLDAKKKEMC